MRSKLRRQLLACFASPVKGTVGTRSVQCSGWGKGLMWFSSIALPVDLMNTNHADKKSHYYVPNL
jgi:hypothetical protein